MNPETERGSVSTVWRYRLYGLQIAANRPLPRLIEADSTKAADIAVEFLDRTIPLADKHFPEIPFSSVAAGTPALSVHISRERRVLLRFGIRNEFAEFEIDPDAKQIRAVWSGRVSADDAAAVLVGPVMGYALRLLGDICLHASAVSTNKGAVLFLGRKGAGKSTIASAFSKAGLPVLTDDLAVLRHSGSVFFVQPGYPYLRLKKDAAEICSKASQPFPLISRYMEKYAAGLDPLAEKNGWHFCSDPMPIAAFYLLDANDNEKKEIKISRLSPDKSVISLFQNRYPHTIPDKAIEASCFRAMGRVAGAAPVKMIRGLRTLTDLPRLQGTILDDIHSL